MPPSFLPFNTFFYQINRRNSYILLECLKLSQLRKKKIAQPNIMAHYNEYKIAQDKFLFFQFTFICIVYKINNRYNNIFHSPYST